MCSVHPHTGHKAYKAHADDGTVRERHKDSDAVAGSILCINMCIYVMYIYIYIYIYISGYVGYVGYSPPTGVGVYVRKCVGE